jgi:glycosyltransferase involved in cell wall biosynthesis
MTTLPTTHRAGDPPHAAPDLLPGLSVVLPCFNEAGNVEHAIDAARSAAAANAVAYEIVVVDDGSTDGTGELARAAATMDAHVRVVSHEVNRGYGAALTSGFDAARMSWVLLTDADLQFDLDELRGFVGLTREADMVLGWRIARQDPLHRRINAAAWNWLVDLAFDLDVRDVDCAFKLIRRDVLQAIPLTSTGAMISTELLVRARANGARLREIGVHHRPRVAGDQSGAAPRVVLRALRELAGLRRELRLARASVPPTSPAAA